MVLACSLYASEVGIQPVVVEAEVEGKDGAESFSRKQGFGTGEEPEFAVVQGKVGISDAVFATGNGVDVAVGHDAIHAARRPACLWVLRHACEQGVGKGFDVDGDFVDAHAIADDAVQPNHGDVGLCCAFITPRVIGK